MSSDRTRYIFLTVLLRLQLVIQFSMSAEVAETTALAPSAMARLAEFIDIHGTAVLDVDAEVHCILKLNPKVDLASRHQITEVD